MGKFNWNQVTMEDVKKAIRLFELDNPEHPEPRSTFLLFEGKKLPAKHIRGMAYKIATGQEITKNDYSGGMDTVKFFIKLGFDMFYNGEIVHGNNGILSKKAKEKKPAEKQIEAVTEPESEPAEPNIVKLEEPDKIKIPAKEVIEQKNLLQLILNRYFDCDIVCEKTYPWLKTPDKVEGDYKPIYDVLHSLQGDTKFAKKNVTLRCDFVCESQKTIIEYDERQHFSHAREVALKAYPADIALGFDRSLWIKACEDIQAKDNSPVNRDEIRAYYDSTRDIECARNGYRLIRIMHGQFDWNRADALEHLKELLAYTEETVKPESIAVENRKGMRIGLYLQTMQAHTPEMFSGAMNVAKKADIDILVFPENCYCPEIEDLWQYDVSIPEDVDKIFDYCLSLSEEIGKAVVFSAEDVYGTLYSVFANNKATKAETQCSLYIKHTMTNASVFEFDNYPIMSEWMFQPIIYKGYKIGLTICYDCNHAPFSRAWGKQGVDIIINSTGGDVVYDKWYKYNRVRSIENNCYSFVTMGGAGTAENPHTYVYGFNREGKELPFTNLMKKTDKANEIDTIYVFDTADDDKKAEVERGYNQAETLNKKESFFFPVGGSEHLLSKAKQVTPSIYRISQNSENIILCLVDGMDIMKPERVLNLLYSPAIKGYSNKRYVVVNRHEHIDEELFRTKLSTVLKVRAMENYCAVILESDNINHCYQTGQNRTAQIVQPRDGKYGIDLARTSGAEAIWKNKQGMRATWRDNFEFLIGKIQ